MVFDTGWQNSTSVDNSTDSLNSTIPWPPILPDASRSLQADIVACAVIAFMIALSFVALRFYTRGRVNHVLGASDWCILPALLCAAGVTASSIERMSSAIVESWDKEQLTRVPEMVHGAGRHAWEIDPYNLPAFERVSDYITSATVRCRDADGQPTPGCMVRDRLLQPQPHPYKGLDTLVVQTHLHIHLDQASDSNCHGSGGRDLDMAPCIRLHRMHSAPSLSGTGRCTSYTQVYCQPVNIWWANAALHIASDMVIMAAPMAVLSTLKIPRRQKYAIVGVFALGFL
ncbi:hypothetical protein VTI74DRAFT_7408 [Chaetomium olivicolor]